jgi:hypothetical protein
MHRMRTIPAVVVVGMLLAGCGTTTEERALSGGAIGAAGGAVIGALTGSWAIGAVVGAASGVAAGALTTPDQVDLGKPVWKRDAQAAAAPARTDAATVRNIQSGLQRLGYDPGPADGVAGPKTRTAIAQYQRDSGVTADGEPSPALWNDIRQRN